MNTLVRAAEIWVPDADGYLLEWNAGAYGAAREFDGVSRALVFGRGEGLPGRVWDSARPILLDRLDAERFRRANAAAKAGYRAAAGLPFFLDGRVAAVAVLFFGDADAIEGAVELVAIDAGTRTVLGRFGMPRSDDDGVALPIATSDASRFALMLHGRASTTIGQNVARWTRDQASDATPSGAAAAAVFATGLPCLASGVLGLPTVCTPDGSDEVVTIAL